MYLQLITGDWYSSIASLISQIYNIDVAMFFEYVCTARRDEVFTNEMIEWYVCTKSNQNCLKQFKRKFTDRIQSYNTKLPQFHYT